MDRSAFHLYIVEIAVFIGIMVFLIFFRGMEILEILNTYGVPLLIYIAIFAAYPVYKLIRKK